MIEVFISSAIDGIAGKYASIPSGPMATIAPKKRSVFFDSLNSLILSKCVFLI